METPLLQSQWRQSDAGQRPEDDAAGTRRSVPFAANLAASGYICKPHPADHLGDAGDMAKTPVAPSPSTELFRHNLQRLMAADRSLGSQPKVSERSKVAQTSVGRILRGEQSPTLDMVHKLAHAFDLEPWQMLVPGLDPSNPPITKQVDDEQKKLWERFKTAAQDLAAYAVERRRE